MVVVVFVVVVAAVAAAIVVIDVLSLIVRSMDSSLFSFAERAFLQETAFPFSGTQSASHDVCDALDFRTLV